MKEHRHVQTAHGPAGEEAAEAGGRFPQIGLETRKIFSRSDTRVESRAIDLSRARRRTHGTPRTTRHATRTRDACSHSRLCSRLGGPPVFTPNLRCF